MGTRTTDCPAFLNVPIGKTMGRLERQVLLRRNRLALGQHFPDLTQGVDRVHSGRTGGGENSLHLIEMSCKRSKPFPPEGPRTLGKTIGSGGTDSTGTPDDHVADGRCRLEVAAGPNTMKSVGQQPLLNQDNGVSGRIEFDGSEVTDLAADHDVHRRQD
jgi:hypothetical protein